MASNVPRGPRQIFAAFQWSMKGLKACFRHEASFRLEVFLAVVVVPLGLWVGNGAVEKIVLVSRSTATSVFGLVGSHSMPCRSAKEGAVAPCDQPRPLPNGRPP